MKLPMGRPITTLGPLFIAGLMMMTTTSAVSPTSTTSPTMMPTTNQSTQADRKSNAENDLIHPIFICFFVMYFFGFSLVFCYAIYLLSIKIKKWLRRLSHRLKRGRGGGHGGGRTSRERNLYPSSDTQQPNQSLQYLFYVQIIPYFLIRFLIYFLAGFQLLPDDYFAISNNWSHSQIFLVSFTLSGILLHNTYFLIVSFITIEMVTPCEINCHTR